MNFPWYKLRLTEKRLITEDELIVLGELFKSLKASTKRKVELITRLREKNEQLQKTIERQVTKIRRLQYELEKANAKEGPKEVD